MPTEPSTLPELLRRNRSEYGDKPVVVTADDRLTHAELDERSRDIAAALVAAGIGKSARVGLMAPNGIDWAVMAAAVGRIGAVLVPLSTLLRPPELAAQLAIADVTELIVAREFRGRSYLDEVERIKPPLPTLRRVWPIDGLPSNRAAVELVTAREDVVRPANDLVIMFTSGSRGAPKGVVHTHHGALLATASGLASRCITADDRLYIPMPFFWTGGFNGGLLSALVAGATLLTEAIPEPAATLELLQRERATLFRGWPDQAARLAAEPAFADANLSCLGPGSLPAVLPTHLPAAAGARANLFGMTETGGPYCGDRLDRDLPAGKHGSCGRPFAGIEVQIVDAESGDVVGPDATGEIRVRGPRVCRTIRGRLAESVFDTDGFYPTGDLGTLDRDGYLYYRGRLDDMVKVKGATVFPTEVEAALRGVPGVRQAHVTDVPTDAGIAVAALIVTDRDLSEIAADLRTALSAFKLPSLWLRSASAELVPLLASSKVDKAALQQLLLRDGVALGTDN